MASIDAAGWGDRCVLWPGIRRIGSFWGVGGGGFVRWVAGKNSVRSEPKRDGETNDTKASNSNECCQEFLFHTL